MHTDTRPSPHVACAVNRLVPFVHVADVEASLAFYALLGFAPQNIMKDVRGRASWALAQSAKAEIMLARADGPVDAEQQAVLFYMYSTDIAGVRRHLLENGLRDGGVYHGVKGLNDRPGMVFEVAHRDYMPGGEVRIADPDGYIILIGQLA
jgi:hypothetical protein